MGTAWICPKCDVNLSDECSKKWTEGKQKNFDDKEKAWMRKLKCKDLDHSKENGLTEECFYKLLQTVESKIMPIRDPPCPNKDILIECIKRNPCCMIKCNDYMKQFIDCVDTHRINKIKRQIKSARKAEKQKETNEIFN